MPIHKGGRRGLLVVAAVCLLSKGSLAAFGDLFQSPSNLLEGAAPLLGNSSTSGLSNGQINDGLKQALSIGAERAVAVLGREGGFLNDGNVRIPLPGVLEDVGKGLRAVGQGQYVDQFEQAVNRAAEQAVPRTLDIVKSTVQNMSLQDVRGILAGGNDAATRFLRERAGQQLHTAIKPIVAQATDSAGATAAYKNMMSQSGGAGGLLGGIGSNLGGNLGGSLGGLLGSSAGSPSSLDLDEYVTNKTLDGLFFKLAAEEKAIRENPLARSTDLLKQVFGN